MIFNEKYDKTVLGAVAGFLLPFIAALFTFLFTRGGLSLSAYLEKLSASDIVTHAISLCVFPNIVIFLVFNRFDMLKAAKGVLGITIFWAVVVFAVKFLG